MLRINEQKEGANIINRYFRGQESKIQSIDKWDTLVDPKEETYISFDDALRIRNDFFNKGGVAKENLILIRRDNGYMKDHIQNGEFHIEGLFSTSISKKLDKEEFGDNVNYIFIPKGTKISYIHDESKYSNEYEVLFNHGNTLIDIPKNLGSKEHLWLFKT